MMIKFCARKIGFFALSMFFSISFTFTLMYSAPGHPMITDYEIPEEVLRGIYSHYGLDQPWYVQYARYFKGIVTWNLGPSLVYEGKSANEIINQGLPISLLLGGGAIAIALFAGIALGTISAIRHEKWQDYTCTAIAILIVSTPNFIVGTMLQYIFAMKLHWLPIARWGGFAHAILPALSLALPPMGTIARLVKTSMIETLSQDYIQSIRAKGIPERYTILRHALKNSLLPIATYLGTLTSRILAGSFVVEGVFGIPGLGRALINSIGLRDYTVIMGITVLYSAILAVSIFAIDLVYPLIDPRMQVFRKKI